jgi:hypothetical protein
MAHTSVAHNLLQVYREADTVLLLYFCCQWPRGSSYHVLTALLPAVTKQATSFTRTLAQHHIPSVLHPLVSIYHTPQPGLSPSDGHSVIAPLHQLHCPVLVIGATKEGANVSVTVTALHAQWVLCTGMYLVFYCHVDVGFVLCAGLRNGQL